EFYEEAKLLGEMERVFDICHGCRRCVNLCTAFPTLFDLVDASATLEVDGVEKSQFWEVVDQCYLCDMCYMTKCPYVPPHPWNVDFPHVMLRAKAVKFRKGKIRLRDRLLSSTDAIGRLAAIPVVAQVVNAVNRNSAARALMDKVIGVHPERKLPPYSPGTFRGQAAASRSHESRNGEQGWQRADVQPLRVLRPARAWRAAQDRLPGRAGKGVLPRPVPFALAEHETEDPRNAAARTGDDAQHGGALLRPRRNLGRQ